jgi:peroxiredoxin
MKFFRLFALTVAALGLAHVSAMAAPAIGETAPDFTATNVHGDAFKLSDHVGDIVVLEWTNDQCPFVKKHYETGNMQDLQKAATADGVKWITINSSAPGRQGYVTDAEAIKIAEDLDADPTTIIRDESGEIGKMYDAQTTPHMFVIDAEGTLVYAGAIDDNSSPRHSTVEGATNYVTAALDSLKAGEAVEVSQTPPYGCGVKYAD